MIDNIFLDPNWLINGRTDDEIIAEWEVYLRMRAEEEAELPPDWVTGLIKSDLYKPSEEGGGYISMPVFPTALVTGEVALILAENPGLVGKHDEVRKILHKRLMQRSVQQALGRGDTETSCITQEQLYACLPGQNGEYVNNEVVL